MLRFDTCVTACVIACTISMAPRSARAAPEYLRFGRANGSSPTATLEDRYVIGSTIALMVTMEGGEPGTTITSSDERVARVDGNIETDTRRPNAELLTRSIRATVELLDVGVFDLTVRSSDGATLTSATIEAVPCESVEIAIDASLAATRFVVDRIVVIPHTWSDVSATCLYDGAAVMDVGVLRARHEGGVSDLDPHALSTAWNGNLPAGLGRYEVLRGDEVVAALEVAEGAMDDIARVSLSQGGWTPGATTMSLHARAFDASGDPVLEPPYTFTVDERSARAWGSQIDLLVDTSLPVVPVCVWADTRSACIDVNAREVPYRPACCSTTSPAALMSLWPLGLGVLFARRVRRRLPTPAIPS